MACEQQQGTRDEQVSDTRYKRAHASSTFTPGRTPRFCRHPSKGVPSDALWYSASCIARRALSGPRERWQLAGKGPVRAHLKQYSAAYRSSAVIRFVEELSVLSPVLLHDPEDR